MKLLRILSRIFRAHHNSCRKAGSSADVIADAPVVTSLHRSDIQHWLNEELLYQHELAEAELDRLVTSRIHELPIDERRRLFALDLVWKTTLELIRRDRDNCRQDFSDVINALSQGGALAQITSQEN